MEKFFTYFTIVVLLLLASLGCLFLYQNMDVNLGARTNTSSSFYGGSWENTNATTTDPTKVATSTSPALGDAVYKINATASSTLVVDVENSDNIYLALFMNATTSPATFHYITYYTYDDIASTTGWYADSSLSGAVHTSPVCRALVGNLVNDYYLLEAPTNRAKKMKFEYTLSGAPADLLLDVYHK